MGANLTQALKALAVAEDAHAGVTRKDGVTPYIEHPMKVASILFDLGCRDENVLATAILHDTVEDTKITDMDLFSEKYDLGPIATYVFRLTKTNFADNDEYYAEIRKEPIATIVKLADRAHNLSTLFNFTEEKKNKYLKETKDYIYPLITYAQHHYYEYSSLIRIFDLWIEAIVKNLEPYMEK